MSGPSRRLLAGVLASPTSMRPSILQGARTIPRAHLRQKLGITQWNRTVVRYGSTEAGEDNTGHIAVGAGEGMLFFDRIYPMKLYWLLRYVPFASERSLPEFLEHYKRADTPSMDAMAPIRQAISDKIPIKVTEISPRIKDGGAFVKFCHDRSVNTEEIEDLIQGYLKEKPIKPWFSLGLSKPIQAGLVRGKPWLEDLYRFPSRRLRVEFVPTSPGGEVAELSQETLYELFRRYGKLAELTSQASDSKILPKFALIDFADTRSSVMAKNCMHAYKVLEAQGGGKAGTELRLSYERLTKNHAIWDWILNHPRVFLPILAAIIAAAAVAIFDPIRTFFVKAHIEHSFDIKNTKVYTWLKSQSTELIQSFRKPSAEEKSFETLWDDRKGAINQIQTWLMESTDNFIVVQGPRGVGKKELIMNQTLKNADGTPRPNVLLIDCKPIQEARGDSGTINAAAAEVGYRPVFSFLNSFSSIIDLAAQGTIGVKSGLSETLDSQLAKIWQNTATALREIGLRGRKKDDKDAHLTDDDYLEAHPERRAVVIIDNFLHKNEESSVVYDKISEWAAGLTTANIAHVIFLTQDLNFSKSLGKALPDRMFRQISLGDITKEVAKKFVISHLDAEEDSFSTNVKLTAEQRREDLGQLDEVIEVLGGRLTDLEFLARRLKSGQTPRQAVHEIIEQSASEIMKMYLIAIDQSDRRWSTEQAWTLVKSLAEQEELRYNEVLLSNTFASSLTSTAKNGEEVLQALSQAEFITINTAKGRPNSIKAGRPVYQAAFKVLAKDRILKSRLDLAILTELTKIETKSIDKYETELSMLASLPSQPREIGPRVTYLLEKLNGSQMKVEAWEREMGVLKKVLMTEPLGSGNV